VDVQLNFWIQASNPKSLSVINEEDLSIYDALQTVFPLITEDAYLVWHHVHIPLGYKYDVSVIITEALDMIEALKRGDSGEIAVTWPSNTFRVDWQIRWNGATLQIDAKWENVVGFTESLLSARPTLTIGKDEFISEWKQLLGVALKALTDAGYRDEQLVDLPRLRRIHDEIRNPGILYS
jgi:hypothetical protein